MLTKLRRVSSISRETKNSSNDRLSNRSSSSSTSKSTDEETNVYIETLLYIVHVNDIDIEEEIDEDEQRINSSKKIIRRMSKRTTASFNEHHHRNDQLAQVPISNRPSFSFSNPLRRLNSLLKNNDRSPIVPSTPTLNNSPLCSSTQKRTNSFLSLDENEQNFPPPPPSFLYDNPTSQLFIQANGPGLNDGFVNDQCYFDLNAPNAELQKLVIAIDGPSKADIQIEVVETGIYRVFYTCQSPGCYHISLTYDGTHISNSPYHLQLKAQTVEEENFLPTATVQPNEFIVNSPCIVSVCPTIPCSIFQAFIQTPDKSENLPITVHKSEKSDSYEIYFIPRICGDYWLNISLNHKVIIDNPHRLMIRSRKRTTSTENGFFHGYSGSISQFFVSKCSNNILKEKGKFSVGISGPSTVHLDANESEHGYQFYYKPIKCGKYFLTIKNDGKQIEGSPFICQVYNKLNETGRILSSISEKENDFITETTKSCHSSMINPSGTSINEVDLEILRSSMSGDASQVCVFGTGLYEAKPRRKATFKIDASQAGPGLLLVGLYSSIGPSERLVIKRSSSSPHISKVSYRVRKRGQYMLVILFGLSMQHVPGSPYLVLVE